MSSISNSKLLRNLACLSPREKARFLDFVNSPFFNTHPCTCALAQILLQEATEWSHLTRQMLSARLYPDSRYEETRINNVMSYLMKLLKKFLTQLGLEASGQEQLYFLQAAQERWMTKLVVTEMKAMSGSWEKEQPTSAQRFMVQSQLEKIRATGFHRQESDKTLQSLDRAAEAHYQWSLLERLEKACMVMATANQYEKKISFPAKFQDLLMPPVSGNEELPLVTIYRKCLYTIIYPEDEAHYLSVKAGLQRHQDELPDLDQKNVYRHLLNYCARKTIQNKLEYQKEMLELYQTLTERNLILEREKIYPITYNNITSLACLFGKYEWAANFIEEYAPKIFASSKENVYQFNLGKLRFYEKKYEEALQLFGMVKFTNSFYQVKSRMYQIMIYYELKEMDVMLSALESLRLYLLRSREAIKYRKSGNRFIRHAKKLVDLQVKRNGTPASKLAGEFTNLKQKILAMSGAILEREWLLSKTEEKLSS